MTLALQVDQTALLLDVDQKMVLARLENHVATGAAFDSREEEHNSKCLPNTRVELLQQISEWADDSSAEAVFWLNGMAGTGKSTISRTVARSLAKENRLGASFFFKSGEADRGNMAKFFPTIAADLVRGEPAIAHHLKGVIEREPAIFRKAMREQFDKLFLGPLSITRRNQSLVVVVDALDECEQEIDVKLMIRLFSQASSLQSVQVKVFLTSRPELPIRLGFKAVEGKYQDLTLHEIPSTVVEHDISMFLRHELASIRGEYNASVQEHRRLAVYWPGQSNIQSLIQMTSPLFIFAATVCRFVNDRRCGNPDEQLNEVLLFRTKSQASQLDATYMPVLNKLIEGVPSKQRDQILQNFRDIIGSIIILAKPLSTAALGQILRIPESTIDDRLDLLHSVLSIPSSSGAPVRLLHLSFRDFLLDPEKRDKSPFWVDEKLAHDAMAANCLRVMDCLKQDICQLEAPGTDRSDIDPLTVDKYLPSELQYACLYWVYHVQGASNHQSDCERVYAFLKQHFIHWLEALSLLGKAWESVHIVKDLQALYKNHGHKQLSEFLDDAERFILANSAIIDSNPLQIYSSLLMFTPRNTHIYTTFKSEIPPWISLLPQVENEWDSCILTLQGHKDRVTSVAFSHDSALVASGSRDKYIRIWRSDTGECIQTSKCHESGIISVNFLHDSAVVRYVCDDFTVHSWRLDTGDYSLMFKSPCHRQSVRPLAFSHDSTLVALKYYHEAILLWKADAGGVIQILECPGVSVTSAAFSQDSALLASACSDDTMRIWRVDTGECVHRLDILAGCVLSVTFSPDSTLVASSSINDHTLRIWRADTGECVQTMSNFIMHHTSEVAFSEDGALITSNTMENDVLIWQIDTGECVQILRGHMGIVESVTMSRDSKLVATGSWDRTIRIWRADTITESQTIEGEGFEISRLAFSSDSTLIASTSMSRTRVCRAETGGHIQTLDGDFCCFAQDSTLVATDLGDMGMGIWRIDTGECVQKLADTCRESYPSYRVAAFSPDSALVASAYGEKIAESGVSIRANSFKNY
ncbi:uncharacterized protein F5Z01DRAFT_9785 [Emericellopsis atlantica]|uniref:NACHT domain-containing protein n=1 Tax=Emericellopsis atlantica TaxID=2614577 RepID=A0A9P7ZV82_9HYPO|nr:uncharacterized protein F5Z01DRAFT_9785 [Emericellopsis atlantica]KAG9258938.1 hypothetical protein F5Z01DRAFT_9785 [Emericellopsis atlantica]